MTRYSVFTYRGDLAGGEPAPIGIAVWSPEHRWHRVRLLQPGEGLAGADTECLAYLGLVQEKLRYWEECGKLPYAEATLDPSDDAWWLHVKKLLVHEVRLSEPKDAPGPFSRDSVEALFLSVVAPGLPAEERHSHLDKILRDSLRDRYHGLHRFRWRGEIGGGWWRTAGGTVTLNLLDLAVAGPGRHALAVPDAEAHPATSGSKPAVMLVCYLSPPSGVSPAAVLQSLAGEPRDFQLRYFDLFAGESELRKVVEELVESE